MSPWKKLIERPGPHGHLVQLYKADEEHLAKNVSQYLLEGLNAGDGALVIATPEHCDLFSRQLKALGADPDTAIQNRQLKFFDAQDTLAGLMIDGQPNWQRFETVVGAAMSQVRSQGDYKGLRAYGEMVGLLWNTRQFAAAIRLEQFWNRLLGRSSFSLYCAYSIDVFGKDFQVGALDGLLRAHTHLIPAETNGTLESSINRAMEDILGSQSRELKLLIKANFRPSWAVMPAGESMALWLRHNLPDQADKILNHARDLYRGLRDSPSLVES
jgi:MEDS: MEthanogen/methylotroph, DcmR Sensory domain